MGKVLMRWGVFTPTPPTVCPPEVGCYRVYHPSVGWTCIRCGG